MGSLHLNAILSLWVYEATGGSHVADDNSFDLARGAR
jgi:hypothetical protein